MPTGANEVWAALAWGGVSTAGLLVGALAGSFSRMPHHTVAVAMSVGAGLLLAAVSLKVAADAIAVAGPLAAALSLVIGAGLFSASNAFLARFGAAHRKRCGDCIQQPAASQRPGSGLAMGIGNALDAVPEALILGLALHDRTVPVVLVAAFSAGNLPEALSSAAGMRAAGRSLSPHPAVVGCDCGRRRDQHRSRVRRLWLAQPGVAAAASGVRRRSAAGDDGGDHDS
jgi:ZIP family zinc transporter